MQSDSSRINNDGERAWERTWIGGLLFSVNPNCANHNLGFYPV